MVGRQDIVKASTELFAAHGFKSTSISDISKAVGLSASAGGIYRHFKSKDAIFDAIFDDYFDNYTTFLTEVDSNINGAEGVDKRQLARTLLELSFGQAKMSDAIITIYLKDRNLLKEKHITQATSLRENSVAIFKFICKYISGDNLVFDADAIAAILIDSINFRVSNFVPDYGISEERYLTSLTDLFYSLVVTEDT